MDIPNPDKVTPWEILPKNEGAPSFEVKRNPGFEGVAPLENIFDQINRRVSATPTDKESYKGVLSESIHGLTIKFIEELHELSIDAIKNTSRPEFYYLIKFGQHQGKYDTKLEELSDPSFVELLPDETDPTDLQIGHNTKDLKEEQQAVIIDLYRTKTVVNIVFDRRQGKLRSKKSIHRDVKALYLKELREIGLSAVKSDIGAEHAKRRLEAFRDSFVIREAEVVKSQHLRRLGIHCLIFGIIALIPAFISIKFIQPDTYSGWHTALILSIMASTSTIGTWLSFSLRKVSITYADLAGLEEDRLDPAGRVIFVILLTLILGLILSSGLIEISLAGEKISFTSLTGHKQVIFASLLGAFAGIGERSMSGLVSRQAEHVLGAPIREKKEAS